MISSTAEPVSRVSRIGLLPMQDRMPQASLGRMDVLRHLMRFIEAGKVEPQTGQRRLSSVSPRKQIGGSCAAG